MDGGENCREPEQPRTEIGQRQAHFDRRTIGLPGHRHDSRRALRDEIEATFRRGRTGLAVAGDRRIDQPRVFGRERRIIEAEPGHHTRTVILDEHIGSPRKPSKHVARRRFVQIEDDAQLAAIDGVERGLSLPVELAIARVESPVGGSILITRAPMSHSSIAQ